MKKGYTLIEVLFVIFILSILLMIATTPFSNSLKSKKLNNIANDLVSVLEVAKTNSMTGKDGQNFGVKFNDDSYVYFQGSTYIPTNENNQAHILDSKYEIEENIAGSENIILFSRISGEPNTAATITIFEKNNPDNKIDVIIGILGDISMLKY